MKTFFTSYSSQDHLIAKQKAISAMIEYGLKHFKDLTNASEEVEEEDDFEHLKGVEAYEAIKAYESRQLAKDIEISKKNAFLKKRQEFIEAIKLANQANQSSKTIDDAVHNLEEKNTRYFGLIEEHFYSPLHHPLGEVIKNLSDIELHDDYILIKKCQAAFAAVAITSLVLALTIGSAGAFGVLVLAAAVITRVAFLSLTKRYKSVGDRILNFFPSYDLDYTSPKNGGHCFEKITLRCKLANYDNNCRTTTSEDAFTEDELDTKLQSLRI